MSSLVDLFKSRLPFSLDDSRRKEFLEELLVLESFPTLPELPERPSTLQPTQQEKKAMTSTIDKHGNMYNSKEPVIVDVPIDLGAGYVVTIKGLPGRPSVAACERLCKVIMAYAVETSPAPQQQQLQQPSPLPNAKANVNAKGSADV